MKKKLCYNCSEEISKDVLALNKKMLGHATKRVLCLTCLAEYLDCSVEELLDLIEEFKEQGCVLFV